MSATTTTSREPRGRIEAFRQPAALLWAAALSSYTCNRVGYQPVHETGIPEVAVASISVSATTVRIGETLAVTIALSDDQSLPVRVTDTLIAFSSEGDGDLSFAPTTDNLDGTYGSTATAIAAGQVLVDATIDGADMTANTPTVEILENAVVDAGLIFHVDADNSFGGAGCPSSGASTWVDLIGGVTGSLDGFPDPPCAPDSGWIGSGSPGDPHRLRLHGDDDFVTFGDNFDARRFTLEIWFRQTGPGVANGTGTGGIRLVPLMSKGRDENEDPLIDQNYNLGLTENGHIGLDFEAAGTSQNHPFSGTTTVVSDVWHHVVATHDEVEQMLFLDAALDARRPLSIEANSGGDTPFVLGSMLNSTAVPAGFFEGELAIARVYDRALTTAEVRQNCHREADRFLVDCAQLGGLPSAERSLVDLSYPALLVGGSVIATLRARDQRGVVVENGGASISFGLEDDGTSIGTFSPVTDHGDGSYTATFTGAAPGTPVSLTARLDEATVTTAMPKVQVLALTPPTAVPTLAAWYQADAAGVTPGATMTTWPDSSGRDFDAAQPSVPSQPIYVADVIGAHGVVRFDGVDDYFDADGMHDDLNAATSATVVAVARSDVDKKCVHFGAHPATAEPEVFRTGWEAGGRYRASVGDEDHIVIETPTEFHIFVSTFDTEVRVWIDGKLRLNDASALPAFSTIEHTTIGQDYDAGWVPTDFFSGDIATLLIFSSPLAEGERRSLELYLSDRYGLPLAGAD